MVSIHLHPQVIVTGRVNGQPVKEVVREETSRAFFLGHPGEQESYVAVGCDDGKRGLRFSTLGPALVAIAGIPTQLHEGIVQSEVTFNCPDGGCREANTVSARYEPGILSFFASRK